jgi:hypothetical protein
MGCLLEGLELSIRKVAYTKYNATWLVPWSNYSGFVCWYINRIESREVELMLQMQTSGSLDSILAV